MPTCFNVDTEQCCNGYFGSLGFKCPKSRTCCGSTEPSENKCCDHTSGETCCAAQYTTQCCKRGSTCCTFPNYHDSVCCGPETLCCNDGSGGGVCCDKHTEVCNANGFGCQKK
jgi:hypothetical protein